MGQTVGCGGGEVSSYPEFKCGKQGHGNPEKWGSVKNSEYKSENGSWQIVRDSGLNQTLNVFTTHDLVV